MNISVSEGGNYAFGAFRLDATRRILRRDGAEVKLTPRQFDTLLLLVRHAGQIVEKDTLMAVLWPGRIVEEANLSQTIFTLRKVLGSGSGEDRLIVTVPGRGYRFAAPVLVDFDEAPPAISPEPASRHDRAVPVRTSVPAFGHPGGVQRRRQFWVVGSVAALILGACLALVLLRPWPVRPPILTGAVFDPPSHSVAVLAFTNMSSDPAEGYFGDGLAEELINALGRLPAMHVAARVSAFSFKGTRATIGQIARSLNVGTVLEGSVRRGSRTIRVSTQLIDARTGYQLWSRSYEPDPKDLLSVERDIAEAVANSLQISLVQGEEARLTLGGTANPGAFDAYLHGMVLLRSNDDGAIAKARTIFDQAIRLDPNYARAYSGRAYALCDIGMNPQPGITAAQLTAVFSAALSDADKAIALAPDLASGHAARAEVLDNGFAKIGEAAKEVAHARDLEPGNAAVVGDYAQIENDLGHFDEAIGAARLAASLDPLRPDSWYVLSYNLYSARRFTESMAVAAHEKSLRGDTLPEHSMEVVARDELLTGDIASAGKSCTAVSESYRDVCLAMTDHAAGNAAAAQTHLARLLAVTAESAPYDIAEVYAQWRDAPHALSWLEAALRTHDPALSQIRSDPLLDPLHHEPRFQAVEQALDLPS